MKRTSRGWGLGWAGLLVACAPGVATPGSALPESGANVVPVAEGAGSAAPLSAAPLPPAVKARAASPLPSDAEVLRILRERIGEHTAHYGIVVGLVDTSGRRIVSHGSVDASTTRVVDGHTLFELGSITKVFTALLLQLSIERGEVALDDPVEKHLPPGTRAPSFQGRSITLRHLATHTSGLPRSPTNLVIEDPDDPYANYTVENLYELLATVQLEKEPGSDFKYSNLGAAVLARALIVRTGKSYAQLVQERIAAPLGLEHTWVDVPRAERAQLAVGHTQTLRQAPLRTRKAMIGNGGVIASASDLLTFLSASMGLIETPLSSAFQTIAREQRALEDGDAIGLGWLLAESEGKDVIWHNGGTAGFRTFVAYLPEQRAGVVALCNLSTPDGVDDIGLHLLVRGPLQPAGAAGVTPSKPKKLVAIAPERLDAYAGDYQLGSGPLLAVQRRGDQLWLTVGGRRSLPLFATSQTELFAEQGALTLRFETDPGGKPVGLVLGVQGKEIQVPRKGLAPARTPAAPTVRP